MNNILLTYATPFDAIYTHSFISKFDAVFTYTFIDEYYIGSTCIVSTKQENTDEHLNAEVLPHDMSSGVSTPDPGISTHAPSVLHPRNLHCGLKHEHFILDYLSYVSLTIFSMYH